MNLPDADFVRYSVVLAFVTLVLCGILLRASHAEEVHADMRMGAWIDRLTLASIPTALVLNDVLEAPLTPGAWLLFWVSLPAALLMLAVTTRALRRAVGQRRAYSRLAEHLSHAEPCGNPDCISARAEHQRIADY